MASTQTASKQIIEKITPGPSRRSGEFASTVARREIGHLHRERIMHTGLPKAVWHELSDQGRIDYRPVLPRKPGYATPARE